MKQFARDFLISAVLGFLLPGIILNYGAKVQRHGMQPTEEKTAESVPVMIRNEDGTLKSGDLEAYLVGVVLAEMPAFFEEEALKAQAVVARTYARKAYLTGGKHGDGSICGNPACCQGYCPEEDYLLQGGTEDGVEKIRTAVLSTVGQVLTYEGELIEATYFSCSGGRTEDAVAVWGAEFPYLRSVDSPGEENAAHYQEETVFAKEAAAAALGIRPDEVAVEAVTYTAGGGVDTITMGGKMFSGTQIRSLLGLRSTAFSICTEGDRIVVTTKGYGHRVGMSQYGADAMAASGSDYTQILSHYYPGTVLAKLDGYAGE